MDEAKSLAERVPFYSTPSLKQLKGVHKENSPRNRRIVEPIKPFFPNVELKFNKLFFN